MKRVTVVQYIKLDPQSTFFLGSFLLSSVLLTTAFLLLREIPVAALIIPLTTLLLFFLVLLYTVLIVRRINSNAGNDQVIGGTVQKCSKSGITLLLKTKISLGADTKIKRSLIFDRSSASLFEKGSQVTFALVSLRPFVNPIPLEMFTIQDGDSRRGEKRFGIAPWFLLVFMSLGVLVVLAIAPVISFLFGDLGGNGYMVYLGASGVLVLTVSFKMTDLSPAILPSGLMALNPGGDRHFVGWGKIISVEKRSPMGLAYLRMECEDTDGSYAWVPLFLKDLDGFLLCVRNAAPSESPLWVKAGELLRDR